MLLRYQTDLTSHQLCTLLKDTHVVLVQLTLLLLAQVDKFLENTSSVVITQQEYLNSIPISIQILSLSIVNVKYILPLIQ